MNAATEALLTRMTAEASARIQSADAKAVRAQNAFAAGKFAEYYQAEYDIPAEEKPADG